MCTGGHLFKFGVDIRFAQQNAFRDVESRGRLQFSPFAQISGNALADLLLGFPLLTSVARVDNPQHLRTQSYNFFLQRQLSRQTAADAHRRPALRIQHTPGRYSRSSERLRPGHWSLVQVGTNGVPRGGFHPDKNNFAPRVGLAWTLGEGQATVVRAGYGVYYDQSPLAPGEALYFNSPYFDNNIFFSLPGLPVTLRQSVSFVLPFSVA